MASEIERKYLVIGNEWKALPVLRKLNILQGYVKKDCRIRLDFQAAGRVALEFALGFDRVSFNSSYDSAENDFDDVATLPNYDAQSGVFTLDDKTIFRLRARSGGGDNKQAFITIKRFTGNAQENQEFEIEIPPRRVDALRHQFLSNTVHKCRHEITHADRIWEVDVFKDHLKGLVMAEIEVADELEFQLVEQNLLPGLGKNVTDDRRYANEMLGKHGIPTPS